MTSVSAAHLLAAVWGEQAGFVFLPVKEDGRWYEIEALTWPVREERIPIGSGEHADLYWCPLVFSQPRRKAEFALPTRWLWADLDGTPPPGLRLRPSVLWKTSRGGVPHHHALWLLDEDLPAQDAAKLSRRIAYATTGADRGGWDVTQVLRIPGSLNHKFTPPHPVELLYAKRRVYTVEQVSAGFPVAPAADDAPARRQWPDVDPAEVERAFKALPYGLRRVFVMDPRGVDRSLEMRNLARDLVRWGVSQDAATLMLRDASINKWSGRRDEIECISGLFRGLTGPDRREHP